MFGSIKDFEPIVEQIVKVSIMDSRFPEALAKWRRRKA
jgi:hypothetical protein